MRRLFTFSFTWLLMLAGLGWSLHTSAAPVPAYRIGDVAAADVVTPVPLDVMDPAGTVALRAAKAKEVPVVFRSFPVSTNGMTVEFLEVFARAQTNFLAAVTAGFHTQRVSPEVLGSAEFGQFFTAFNQQHPRFPLTTELAADWAQGGDGGGVRDRLLGRLQQVAMRPVRPDDLPAGFVPGATVRLVPVSAGNQPVSPEEALRGRLVTGVELMSVAQAQKLFCDGFPAPEQPCARAAAALLKPNCFPDAPLTEVLGGIAVCQLVVGDHYEAGEIILHRGDRVDAKTKAALEMLSAAPIPIPAPKPAPVAVKTVAQTASVNTPPAATALSRGQGAWLILVLTGISVSALLFAWWQAVVRGKQPPAASMALTLPPEQVSNLTQVMREAVMQELAAQRRELLLAQQSAAEEITSLVKRLDELQMPIQEREQTYEARIRSLEEELAQRTAENRELLKMKLDSVRRQLENERSLRTATSGHN